MSAISLFNCKPQFIHQTKRCFHIISKLGAADFNILASLDRRSKSARIQSSIQLYLKRIQDYENMLETERQEFDRGRKYLAQIMGEDPATFNQDKIDESIKYLFPSSLFCLKARPKFKPPEEVFPKEKRLQCDSSGRPLHDLFYTQHPNFYNVLHEAAYQLERLKIEYDRIYISKDQNLLKHNVPIILISSDWFTKTQLEKELSESIMDVQYDQWLMMMNRLTAHPLAAIASDFIFRYRVGQAALGDEEKYPEPEVDATTNRRFIKAFGQKKNAFAETVIYMPGSGRSSINEQSLLDMFPLLGDREQIMFPFQLTKTLGQVDMVAKLSGIGTTSMASALRLSISRCLASLLPENEGKNKLRVAGLLTQDHRFNERKQPGQRKARKKPIWKAR